MIFKGPDSIYKLSAVVEGALFLPIRLGAILSLAIFYLWDNYLWKSTDAGKSWTRQEEYSRLPLACLGGLLCMVSLFWLGCREQRQAFRSDASALGSEPIIYHEIGVKPALSQLNLERVRVFVRKVSKGNRP